MSETHKTSSFIILLLIFLLPPFFVPGGALDLPNAKMTVLVLGTVAATLVFLYEVWRIRTVSLPKHRFVYVAALLPLVYLLSALLSTPSSLSLLGYNMEAGTFGFILSGTTLLILVSVTLRETSRALQALVALFAALSLIALFVLFKIILGLSPSLTASNFLTLGQFFGNMGNPLGVWTDLAIGSGLLSLITLLALGMVPMKLSIKVLLYSVFALSTLLLVVINFSTAFLLTLGASILLFFYFSKVESQFYNTSNQPPLRLGFARQATFLPIVLGIVSLLMLINPTISKTQGSLGAALSNVFNIQNTEVRPTLGATLNISKQVLSEASLLGSGPNTFDSDWLIYKPVNVNATPFWSVAFPYGVGYLPTQIATTGILGSALWLVFFVLIIALIVKAFSNIPESRAERFALVASISLALFIWAGSFLYVPSVSILILGFVLTGLLLGLMGKEGILPMRTMHLETSPSARFGSLLVMVVLVIGALTLGWAGFTKTASAFYFEKAITLANTAEAPLAAIEEELNKTVKFAPVDKHYIAISRLNFAKAQRVANAGPSTGSTSTPEVNRAIFQDALAKSIQAARTAVNLNSAGYQNWINLGLIYSSLVPEPLKVEGAYENAQFAYNEALKRNPNNPELSLYLAQLELNNGRVDTARSYIRNSIALKEDYANAYLMLAQLELAQNNLPAAIVSTEALVQLAPNNAGIHFELGLLKYSSEDYNGAANAFAKALSIAPDYANAKYYLGLSFVRLGRIGEARVQFEELLATNQDNAELKRALEDLSDTR